jgi:hypothetical protein
MKEAGNLVPSGTPPAEPHPDFRRNHPDFDAPVEKQLEAGNLRGKVRYVQRTPGAAPGAGRPARYGMGCRRRRRLAPRAGCCGARRRSGAPAPPRTRRARAPRRPLTVQHRYCAQGVAAANPDFDFDAPIDKLKEVLAAAAFRTPSPSLEQDRSTFLPSPVQIGRAQRDARQAQPAQRRAGSRARGARQVGNVVPAGTPPPEPHPDFRRNHPDFDAPVEKQLKAGNIKPTPEA